MTSSPIAGLAYVVVQTSDVDAWRDYATGVIGLMPSKLPLPEGSYAFRMDERIARFIVQPGENSVAAVGWDVPNRQAWAELMERLEKAGVEGKLLSREESAHRGAIQVYRVTDPSGGVVEFVYQALIEEIENFVSPLGVRFVTDDQSMGHVTRAVSNYQPTVDFYVDVLGMELRETIEKAISASFASSSSRHHLVALIDGHGHDMFHHVMLEVDTIDDVGRALDKVSGTPALTVGLGRHIFDGMTSFYMASPSGLQIEYGFGGRRVDNPWVARSQGGVGGASLWGHHPAETADHGAVAAGFRA
jgi:2,3-dihydroxybiphenyl 1,2-dioxygenase